MVQAIPPPECNANYGNGPTCTDDLISETFRRRQQRYALSLPPSFLLRTLPHLPPLSLSPAATAPL